MLNIAVCDDDSVFRVHLCNMLSQYFESKHMEYTLHCYATGEALVADERTPHDIIFLDILMAELNGLEVADTLQKRGARFQLIFVSSIPDYARHGYKYRAFRYELKAELDASLAQVLDILLSEMEPQRYTITLSFVGTGEKTISLNDVVFLESIKHNVFFHGLKDEQRACLYTNNCKLDDYESLLRPTGLFIRIHKSYLVNQEYVRSTAYNVAFLSTGEEIPISQKRYSAVRAIIMRKGDV